jgi:transcriptional regulator with XRE-family HTH domain
MRNLRPTTLSEVRKAKGMKRSDLARAAGMQAGTIAWIETGRFVPYPSQLEKLAAALGVDDPDMLMDDLRVPEAMC